MRNCFQLAGMFPGSMLGEETARPVPRRRRHRWQAPGGEQDHIIPAALQHYMAERAGARRTTEIPAASHAITVSQPEATAQLILEAAGARVGA